MQNENMLIKIKAKNPDVARKLEGVVRSLEGVQVHGPGTGDEIALLILELGEDPERDFWDVEALLRTKAVEEVFVTSRDNSPDTLMKVIRTGAKEFLSQPLVDEEVRQALLRCKERRNGSQRA
jgi:pilus assembly protein CpaE